MGIIISHNNKRVSKLEELRRKLKPLGIDAPASIKGKGHKGAWLQGWLAKHNGEEKRSPFSVSSGCSTLYHRAWLKGYEAREGWAGEASDG